MAITIDGSNNTITGISNTIEEDDLKVSNAGSNGQFLQKQSGNTGGLTWASAEFDDTNIRKDLTTLALQTAVDTNRKAYNLQNSFIDQFEDDTGIGTETTVDRDATGEFVASIYTAQTAFAPPLKTARSNPTGTVFTRSGSSVTNDSYELSFNGGGDPNYPGCYIDYLWDLSTDWTCRLFYNDTSGDQHDEGRKYGAMTILITTDTSKPSGASPTGVFNAPQANGNGVEIVVADWGNNRHLTTAYGTTALGVENYTETNTTGSSDQSIDCNSTNRAIRHYENSNSTFYGGFVIQHTASSNTITCKHLNYNSRSATHTNAEHTITEVPSSGRVILYTGTGDPTDDLYVSTTYNGGSTANWSTASQETINATGTVVSNKLNTDSVSRTKVSGVLLYKDNAGTATIGTDLKVYFTCDGNAGSPDWKEVTDRTAGSDFSTGIKTLYLNETTCDTAGTDVRYKVEWANQASGSKETQLHGIGVNW